MGGAGKSEACLKFAHENQERSVEAVLCHPLLQLTRSLSFWGVFWVDAGSITSIERDFIHAATRSGSKNINTFEDAKVWFENLSRSWLLILDNADSMGKRDTANVSNNTGSSTQGHDQDNLIIDYSKYIPSGDRGSVLITTRNEDCARYGIDGRQRFEKLEFEDSVVLLLKSAGIDEADWDQNRDSAMAIVGENCLTQHALAIVQAGAFIRQGLCRLKEYPDYFKRQRIELMKHRPEQTLSEYGDVYATFEVSAMAMKSGNQQHWKDALQLLKVLAFLDRQDVPKEMFDRAWEQATAVSGGQSSDRIWAFSMWHVTRARKLLRQLPATGELDQLSLAKARRALQLFSLITINPDTDSISMHPLVHAWAKDRLEPDEQNESWTSASSILALSTTNYLSYQDFFRKVQSHVLFCVGPRPEHYFTQDRAHDFEVCRTLYCFTYLLIHMRHDATAEKTAILLTSRLGPDIPRHTTDGRSVLYALASCQQYLQKYEESVQLLKEVISYDESSISTLDLDHSDCLDARGLLGTAYYRLNQPKEAIKLIEGVLETFRKIFAPNNESLLVSQRELAAAYILDRQPEQAIKLLEEVVKISTWPPTHPDRLLSQHNLGRAYIENRQIQTGTDLLEEVVRIKKTVSSSTDRELLGSQHELGRAYIANRQIQTGIDLLQEVVRIRKTVLSPTDPELLASQGELGRAYVKNLQIQTGIDLLEEVTRIKKTVSSSTDPSLLRSQHELGRAYIANRQIETGIDLLEEVVRIKKTVLSPTDRSLLVSQQWLEHAYHLHVTVSQ